MVVLRLHGSERTVSHKRNGSDFEAAGRPEGDPKGYTGGISRGEKTAASRQGSEWSAEDWLGLARPGQSPV